MALIVLRWLTTSAAILIVSHIVSGVHVAGVPAALMTAAVLALLNHFARPVLVFLTLPFTFLSLGLFLFVINAALLELAASFVEGFHIDSFGDALLASVLISALSWLLALPSKGVRVHVVGSPPPRRPERKSSTDGTIDLERDEQGKWR